VTGAGSGIGRAVATALVAAGAVAALLDRNRAACEEAASELRAQGGRVLAIDCDTSDAASVGAAAEQVRRTYGACDVLVNNAGLLRAGALESLSLAEWNQVLSVNLTGYLLCAQAPGVAERRAQVVPSRRVGTPQDIADVVLYLASDRAAYVNGADVAVDGGFAAVLMDTVPRPGF